MMETNQVTKKILEFQRGAFSNWYGVMTAMQDQAASSMKSILDQSGWIPAEGRQMVQSWVTACKKGCNDYKAYVEESISDMEKVLVVPVKKSSTVKKTAPKGKAGSSTHRKVPVATARQAAPATPEKPVVQVEPAASVGEKDK